MSGTIPLSLSQQFDKFGKPLGGGRLYIIQAGTTSTPQTAYQDGALTLPYPGGSTLTLDAAGRIGQFFLADGLIKVRLTDKNGVTQLEADGVQVIGPSSGGGGGGAVDPTTIMQTGDVKARYGTGVLAGFVRLNGRTIGSATSGATERANSDTQFLFEYLWQTDSTLAVSTGRGASSAADWAANKTIALPDGRGRSLAALDDMGATAAGVFTGSTFANGNATTLGSRLGIGTPKTLAQNNLPNIAPSFTGTPGIATSNVGGNFLFGGNVSAAGSVGGSGGYAVGQSVVNQITSTYTPSGTISSINGGVTQTTFDTVSPFLLVTIYMKL